MKIGIMQSYFFPYLGYFQLIDSVDEFLIYDAVSFRKRSWITRNKILDKGSNSCINITANVVGQSSNKLIKEITLDKNLKWKKKLLNLIFFNYKKAKHFNIIYPFLKKIIEQQENYLHSYNSLIIAEICKLLNFGTKIEFKNYALENIEHNLINDKDISKESIKSERIIRLCKYKKATTYINPSGGKELYDKGFFNGNNIELLFIKTLDYKYEQFGETFTPNLSIIDILMHAGIEETKKIIKKYTLI
jgi:hypothetical protein